MMKIGFDAKRLFHNTTGLGHYSRTLIQLLLGINEDLEIVLFDSAPTQTDLTLLFYSNPRVRIVQLDYPGWYYRSIDLSQLIKKENLAVYHGLSNELPMWKSGGIPYVVTIHDLLYQSFPNDFAFIDRAIYNIKTRQALKNADVIIAISEATKKSILESFVVDENKIKVIYQSYDPNFNQQVSPFEIEAVLNKYQLPTYYNYYVGSVTYRKNLKIILEAMVKQNPVNRLPLLIAGDGTTYLKEINAFVGQNKLSKLIYHLPNLPRETVRKLYKNANAIIYPSMGEGFGLPVLEGIAANVPVITSNRSSLPEAGGDVAIYFNPQNSDELAAILDSLDKDSYLIQTAEKRKCHLKKFQPNQTVQKYFQEVYFPLTKI